MISHSNQNNRRPRRHDLIFVSPVMAAAIVHVFPVPSEIAKVSILLAAVPSGFFGILFAENYRVRSPEVGSMVIASTVFSIATLAITIGILYPQ
jgi:malonate transporter